MAEYNYGQLAGWSNCQLILVVRFQPHTIEDIHDNRDTSIQEGQVLLAAVLQASTSDSRTTKSSKVTVSVIVLIALLVIMIVVEVLLA